MVTVLKSAKCSEIIVASFLDEFYYNNVHLIVGDSEKMPDIVEQNNKFAIEVVSSELDDFWNYVKLKKRSDNKGTSIHYSYDSSYEIIKRKFIETIVAKNCKLNKGNYSRFHDEIYLAIESMRGVYDKYDLISIHDAIKEISTSTPILFSKIFWLSRNAIYIMDLNTSKQICEFSEQEYRSKILNYERKFNKTFSQYK